MATKSLTVHLPDEVFERAQRRAADHGATLPGEVAELIKRYSEGNGQEGDLASGATRPSGKTESSGGLNEALQELTGAFEEGRAPNWDGQGAKAVEPQTLAVAQDLVRLLPADTPLPSVGMEPDGHLTLEWYRKPRWTLFLSVSPESDLFYAGLFDQSDVRGHEVFTGEVPAIILAVIRRVFAP
jgi:hypothetical protein